LEDIEDCQPHIAGCQASQQNRATEKVIGLTWGSHGGICKSVKSSYPVENLLDNPIRFQLTSHEV